jgi:hypothetical protein
MHSMSHIWKLKNITTRSNSKHQGVTRIFEKHKKFMHWTNKNLLNVLVSMDVTMCHVFLITKLICFHLWNCCQNFHQIMQIYKKTHIMMTKNIIEKLRNRLMMKYSENFQTFEFILDCFSIW